MKYRNEGKIFLEKLRKIKLMFDYETRNSAKESKRKIKCCYLFATFHTIWAKSINHLRTLNINILIFERCFDLRPSLVVVPEHCLGKVCLNSVLRNLNM